MVDNSDWQTIAIQIELTTNRSFSIINARPVSGGCINSAYLLQGKDNSYFIKINQAQMISMFEAEFSGLKEIEQTHTIKVPQPILSGIFKNNSFLVLESIILKPGSQQSDKQLGHQLAALHQLKQPFFGWHIDNTIGSTEQINHSSNNWLNFWRTNRLDFQLSLAEKNGFSGTLIESGEKLSSSLHHFFIGYTPHPSLLHGDLWAGNAAMTDQGEPIIYDPACYYGDRETDIAMTELFGGFSSSFYAAYNEYYPLDSAYSLRKTLYNLYHILNHLNLFGASYQQQAQNMMDSLLAEIS